MDEVIKALKDGCIVAFDDFDDFYNCVKKLHSIGAIGITFDKESMKQAYDHTSRQTKDEHIDYVCIRLSRNSHDDWLINYSNIEYYAINMAEYPLVNYYQLVNYELNFDDIY